MNRHSISQLWEDYKKREEQGIKEPYIYANDLIVVQSVEYMKSQSEPLDNPVYEIADQILQVVRQYEVDVDLWYTVVRNSQGEEYTLYDDNIKYVLRFNRSK